MDNSSSQDFSASALNVSQDDTILITLAQPEILCSWSALNGVAGMFRADQ